MVPCATRSLRTRAGVAVFAFVDDGGAQVRDQVAADAVFDLAVVADVGEDVGVNTAVV